MNENHKTFLSAEWRHLVLFNFAVPDDVLLPYLPSGCELDRYEDHAFVSLVGFQFLHTRVLGVRWPGFVNFPEINLRFYIRHQGRRGVCFIREYVPSRLVAGIAKLLYNEPYHAAAMMMDVVHRDGHVQAKYTLNDQNCKMNLRVTGQRDVILPHGTSLEHFFKEHDLGVGRDRRGRTVTYEVWHPVWNVFPVVDFAVMLDWEKVYGKTFGFLQEQKPHSVCFAEGSEIRVYWKS